MSLLLDNKNIVREKEAINLKVSGGRWEGLEEGKGKGK